ncbi:hypothetical protein Scep_021064 [Stephania cephalantha]|uniref:Uncharacterized protein n=1 Tax=Stephania cephalantha TaxID=152367 RepID=A0AAP0I187_9MAGN
MKRKGKRWRDGGPQTQHEDGQSFNYLYIVYCPTGTSINMSIRSVQCMHIYDLTFYINYYSNACVIYIF